MAYFLIYAGAGWPIPLEVYHLEPKMVHLAWRVQHGVRLYPEWRDYPHVANFFGPCYFGLVGLLGRLFRSRLDDLFQVGRSVSLAFTLATAILVTALAGRSWGRLAALTAAALSLGAGPMIGYGVMTRPDAMADFLGLAGFLLAVSRHRLALGPGALLLVLAFFTKQTSAVYLLAAALALVATGRKAASATLLVSSLTLTAGIVAFVTLTLEPRFASSLLGEAHTPWSLRAWLALSRQFLLLCPDLLTLLGIGIILWLKGPTRDVRLVCLAAVMLAVSLVSSAKLGAALNYYLGLCSIAALAGGTLAATLSRAKGRDAWLCAPLLVAAVVSVGFSAFHTAAQASNLFDYRRSLGTDAGRSSLKLHRDLGRIAADPTHRLLTNVGWIDIHQGERTAFADPWLFRTLVDAGQIHPERLRSMIEREEFDLVVTRKPLEGPGSDADDFGFPGILREAAARHYETVGFSSRLYVYQPRSRRK